jgi:DNA repair photolyase
MDDTPAPLRGRGAAHNPANRFEPYRHEVEVIEPDETSGPTTQFIRDRTRSIIAYNDSPDVGFSASINPYRGCEHGCLYCYARPTHEYLGFSAGLDFETKILVKKDAPQLLRRELASPRWQPQVLGVSGVTDAYQPIERKLQLTRQCLEVLVEFRNPAAVVTKSRLVTRDADLLAELARHQAAVVMISVTTLDAALQQKMEPRAPHPEGRLAALRELSAAGVPVGVLVAPIIPGLNDHEIPAVLEAATAAGARQAGYVTLRLPHGLADLFEHWLEQHFPQAKEKILGRIRQQRGGKLNESQFGKRMRGEGDLAQLVNHLFKTTCQRLGLNTNILQLSSAAFRRSRYEQPSLFE